MTQEQKSTKKPDQAEQTSPAHEILSLLLYIVIVFGICFLIITFVGQRSRVSGSSMEPTLSDGDNLIVDKISYRLHDPERFDIIIFPYRYEENTYYIKRIIGLPGETVYINDARRDLYQRHSFERKLRTGDHPESGTGIGTHHTGR